MWQVLLAAAVAGTGICAKNLFFNKNGVPTASPPPPQTEQKTHAKCDQNGHQPFSSLSVSNVVSESNQSGDVGGAEEIFRISSSGVSKKPRNRLCGFKKKVEVVVERFSRCFKKKRASKAASVKSSTDGSSFVLGLGIGIMYMSAGKAEIMKLKANMDETAKVVQELKTELSKIKSSCNLQVSSEADTSPKKIRGKHTQQVVAKSSTGNQDPNDTNISSLPLIEDGEYASSVLNEEPLPEVLEMDQLEPELEFELQKLPCCSLDAPCYEVFRPDLGEPEMDLENVVHAQEVSAKGFHEMEGQSSDSYQFHGVLPAELDQKQCHVLIKQQDNQMVELEFALYLAHSKLLQNKAKFQALKHCVKRLNEFSMSTSSDDEAESPVEQQSPIIGNSSYDTGNDSKRSAVGMKRALDSTILFDGNKLSGAIPDTLGLVQTLEVLRLDRNSLIGPVPSNLNNLTNVNELNLAYNQLTGTVPNLTGMDHLSYVKLKDNSFNDTFSMGDSIGGSLQLVDLQNNQISSVTLSSGYTNSLVLVGNPVCNTSLSNTVYCQNTDENPKTYATNLANCGNKLCSPDEKLNPQSCECAYAYEGTLYFRGPSFRELFDSNIFHSLESSLWNKLNLTPGSVFLENPFFNINDYLQIQLALFPPTGKYFNRSEVARIGFAMSNQTYKPPHQFGPYYFIASPYHFQGTTLQGGLYTSGGGGGGSCN